MQRLELRDAVTILRGQVLTTTWLTVVGFTLELVGLLHLSRELLESKSSEAAAEDFTRLQDDLETSVRELILRMNAGLTTLAEFMRGHLSILELEAEYNENPKAFAANASHDPSLRQVLDLLQGHSPRALRRRTVEKFVETSAALLNREQTDRAMQLGKSVRAEIERNYAGQVARTRRLATLARLGTAFVAVGASLQLVDMLFF